MPGPPGWASPPCQRAALLPDMGNRCSPRGGPQDSEGTPRGRGSPPPVPREASLATCAVLQELSSVRHLLERREEGREVARDWLRVGSALDRLLFRIYLLVVLVYGATLVALWSIWQCS